MNITIIAVGKLKEDFLKKACQEYEKRMSRFCKLNIIELPDEPMSDNPQESEIKAILKKEGDKILSKIKNTDTVVALCVEGKQKTSEEFSQFFDEKCLQGISDFTFVIGGSLGLSEEVKKRSEIRLSFSKMTFPHQLMRVMLLEQIYRAFKISRNESYHK